MEQIADPIDLWCAKPSARSDHSSNSYLATLLSQYKKEIKLDSDSSTALFRQERQIMRENGFDTPGADEDSVSATMELPAVAYSDFDHTVETKVCVDVFLLNHKATQLLSQNFDRLITLQLILKMKMMCQCIFRVSHSKRLREATCRDIKRKAVQL